MRCIKRYKIVILSQICVKTPGNYASNFEDIDVNITSSDIVPYNYFETSIEAEKILTEILEKNSNSSVIDFEYTILPFYILVET